MLLKAAGGGGGIGMQVANNPTELEKQFRACADRARAAFGRDAVYLERYFPLPRHVEVQILGDHHGHLIHCFERECSIQRRHQKVVEESPSPLFIDGKNPELARRMYAAGVTAAKAFGYANAGTVEFLVSGDEFFFIEMNARLQVEHPVTEKVTGLDLIGWQFRIAAGERLTVAQDALHRHGSAIEFRIYAEDPVKFFPSPGPLKVSSSPSWRTCASTPATRGRRGHALLRPDDRQADRGTAIAPAPSPGPRRARPLRRAGHQDQHPPAPPDSGQRRVPGRCSRHALPGTPRTTLIEVSTPSEELPMATEVPAHITGTVWKIEKKVGDKVVTGDVLIILESMKMEMPVEAPVDGEVKWRSAARRRRR